MFPPPGPPPMRPPSAPAGDFDPESPRRNSLTGEVGPPHVGPYTSVPGSSQHSNPLYTVPGVLPPSRLPPPPLRPPGTTDYPESTGTGFPRPSGIPKPGFLAGVSLPSVPRTSSWPLKLPSSRPASRTNSNVPTPTVLSPTHSNFIAEDAASAVIQVSAPTLGFPYAPPRATTGSPRLMMAARNYASSLQNQHSSESQHAHQADFYHPQQQAENEWGQQQQEEPAADYTGDNAKNGGVSYEAGGYDAQHQDQAYGTSQDYAGLPGAPPTVQEQYDQYQYPTEAQQAQQQQYPPHDMYAVPQEQQPQYQDMYAPQMDQQANLDEASRKLPPPASSSASPIKAKYARGAAAVGGRPARPGALGAALEGALPPPPTGIPGLGSSFPPPPPSMGAGADEFGLGGGGNVGMLKGGAGEPAGVNEDMPGLPPPMQDSWGAPAPPSDQSALGSAGSGGLPPPPMGSGSQFPTFPKPIAVNRTNSLGSQQSGSAKSTGGIRAPPPFGAPPPPGGLHTMGSGTFMPGSAASRGSLDGSIGGPMPGVFKPNMPAVPGSPAKAPASPSIVGQQQQREEVLQQQQQQTKSQRRKKKKRRTCGGFCTLLFFLNLALALGLFISVGSTVVAITIAANTVHSVIVGLGNMVRGASLASAVHSMHPAALNIAQHIDSVSRNQWEATENMIQCDEMKPICRGTKWALHSTLTGGNLAKDAALHALEHAPNAWKIHGIPLVEYSKQQGAVVVDKVKGLKTVEGRENASAAVSQSLQEIKALGHNLLDWVHCVIQHFQQSGTHSLKHIVEPAAGCWKEHLGHHLETAASAESTGEKAESAAGDDEEAKGVEAEDIPASMLLEEEEEEEELPPAEPKETAVAAEDDQSATPPSSSPEEAEEGLPEDPYAQYYGDHYRPRHSGGRAPRQQQKDRRERKKGKQVEKEEAAPVPDVAEEVDSGATKEEEEFNPYKEYYEEIKRQQQQMEEQENANSGEQEEAPVAVEEQSVPETAVGDEKAEEVPSAADDAVEQQQDEEKVKEVVEVEEKLSGAEETVEEAAPEPVEPEVVEPEEQPETPDAPVPADTEQQQAETADQVDVHAALAEEELAYEQLLEMEKIYSEELHPKKEVEGDVGPWDSDARKVTAEELLSPSSEPQTDDGVASEEEREVEGVIEEPELLPPVEQELVAEEVPAEMVEEQAPPVEEEEEEALEAEVEVPPVEEQEEEKEAVVEPEVVAELSPAEPAEAVETEVAVEQPVEQISEPEPVEEHQQQQEEEALSSDDAMQKQRKRDYIAEAIIAPGTLEEEDQSSGKSGVAIREMLNSKIGAVENTLASLVERLEQAAGTKAVVVKQFYKANRNAIHLTGAAIAFSTSAFLLGTAFATMKAEAMAARAAAGGRVGAEPITPRAGSARAAAEDEDARGTVYKTARSGRKPQPRVSQDFEEEEQEEAPKARRGRGRQSAPARLAPPAIDEDEEEEAPAKVARGRKPSARGTSSSRGRSKSRAGTSRSRKASVSRRSSKAQ